MEFELSEATKNAANDGTFLFCRLLPVSHVGGHADFFWSPNGGDGFLKKVVVFGKLEFPIQFIRFSVTRDRHSDRVMSPTKWAFGLLLSSQPKVYETRGNGDKLRCP